jgi:hypothetical protein
VENAKDFSSIIADSISDARWSRITLTLIYVKPDGEVIESLSLSRQLNLRRQNICVDFDRNDLNTGIRH